MFTNNQDFYPTPEGVIYRMIGNSNLTDKVVLDPSAGKGDIVDVLKLHSPKQLLGCEIDDNLIGILSEKCDIIGRDFMEITSAMVSHVHFIFMNPPFSADEKHIIHAFEICPPGCEITALANLETVKNTFSYNRKRLSSLISEFGHYEDIGQCFEDAERKTNVEVALIKLFKPKGDDDTEFDGYFDMSEDEEFQPEDGGVMAHNDIREIVNRYVGAVKMFNEVHEASERINALTSPICNHSGSVKFGATITDNGRSISVSRDAYKKQLQKSAWHHVFSKMKMGKYVTAKVMEELNKFVETQEKVPFTMQNVYKMIEMIVLTNGDRMNKILIDIFEILTSRYKENRHNLEGWKTNSMYFVGVKFIAPYCGVDVGYNGQPEINYTHKGEVLDDLTKALCHLTGNNYDNFIGLSDFFRGEVIDLNASRKEYKYKEFGKWYDWNFFEIKVFKKGTLHAKFKDEKVWEMFNASVAKAKGWGLPTNTGSDLRR